MTPETRTHKVRIYYGAPAYQDEPEGRARKAELEREFGLPGEEASIGTGAEGPGLVFLVDIAPLVAQYGLMSWGALTLGKDVTETIAFYLDLAKKLAKYVKGHHTYLERDAAYALALEAVVKQVGGVPKKLVLEGYMTGDPAGGGWDHQVPVTEIGPSPPHLGAFLPHHFQFKIDGKKSIKAVVDPDDVKVFELDTPSASARKKDKLKNNKKDKPKKGKSKK